MQGIYFYNNATLLQDLCCIKDIACGTTTQTSTTTCNCDLDLSLSVNCEMIGEDGPCFSITPLADVGALQYSNDGTNWLPYEEQCRTKCNAYFVFIKPDGNAPFFVSGDSIVSVTMYDGQTFLLNTPPLHTPQDVLSALNALGYDGAFFVFPFESETDFAIMYIAPCGEDHAPFDSDNPQNAEIITVNTGGYEVLAIGYQYFPCDVFIELIEFGATGDWDCRTQPIWFRNISDLPCCLAATRTYKVYDIQTCDCYKVLEVETGQTSIIDTDCTINTTSTSTTELETKAIALQGIVPTQPASNFLEMGVGIIVGSTPAVMRLYTTQSGYNTGWITYDPWHQILFSEVLQWENGETLFCEVSEDGGATISANYTAQIWVAAPISVETFASTTYDIQTHPLFTPCQFLTPNSSGLMEISNPNILNSLIELSIFSFQLEAGNTVGSTVVMYAYGCNTNPLIFEATAYIVVPVEITLPI